MDEAALDKHRESEQERLLLFVCLRENVVLVVKVAERLRQLEGVLCNEGRLLPANRRIHGVVERAIEQK